MNESIGQPSTTSSTTNVSSSSSSPLLGQNLTFTARVSGNGTTPTGSVTFLDGTVVLGTATLDASGTATFSTADLSLGNHAIVAVYSGDGTYASSAASLSQAIVQASSTIRLSSSATSSPVGQSVTFTAIVSGPFGGPSPTGAVSFYDGTTFLGTGLLTLVNGQWQATFTTSALALGTHDILAIYPGDNTFAAGGSSLTQTIHS